MDWPRFSSLYRGWTSQSEDKLEQQAVALGWRGIMGNFTDVLAARIPKNISDALRRPSKGCFCLTYARYARGALPKANSGVNRGLSICRMRLPAPNRVANRAHCRAGTKYRPRLACRRKGKDPSAAKATARQAPTVGRLRLSPRFCCARVSTGGVEQISARTGRLVRRRCRGPVIHNKIWGPLMCAILGRAGPSWGRLLTIRFPFEVL